MAITVRNQDRKSIEVGQISDGEDDNNKVFKHIRPVTYNVHKTDNEAELKALNDDDWEKIRQIKSVDEKKKYAMKAFGNVECGDPSVNRYKPINIFRYFLDIFYFFNWIFVTVIIFSY